MKDKLNKLISTIPYELKECFYLIINEKYITEIKQEFEKLNIEWEQNIKPLTYKNISLVFTDKLYIDCKLKIIPEAKYILKVKSYEENMFENFIKEYENISKKYNVEITGCGCCGSPSIDNLYTIYIANINVRNGKVKYNKSINYKYMKILEKELKEEGKE